MHTFTASGQLSAACCSSGGRGLQSKTDGRLAACTVSGLPRSTYLPTHHPYHPASTAHLPTSERVLPA